MNTRVMNRAARSRHTGFPSQLAAMGPANPPRRAEKRGIR